MAEIPSSSVPIPRTAAAEQKAPRPVSKPTAHIASGTTYGTEQTRVNYSDNSTSSFASSVTNLIESVNPQVTRDRLGAYLARSGGTGEQSGHRIGHWVNEAKEGRDISFRVRGSGEVHGARSGLSLANGNSTAEILKGNIVFDPHSGEYVDILELIRRDDPELAQLIEDNLYGAQYKYDPHQAEMDLISAIMAISTPINALQGLKNLGLESPEAKDYLAQVIGSLQGEAKEELEQLVRLGKDDLAKSYAGIFSTTMRDIADSNTGGLLRHAEVAGAHEIEVQHVAVGEPIEIEVIETDADGIEHLVDVYTAPAEECFVCVEINDKANDAIRDSVDESFVQSTVAETHKRADEIEEERSLAKAEVENVADTAQKVLDQRFQLNQIHAELLALKGEPRTAYRIRASEIERQITGEKIRPDAKTLDELV